MTPSTEAPLASGSLAETPFVHLVLYLYRQSGSGTLHVLGHTGGRARVRIKLGRPVAVRSTEGGGDLLNALLPLCGLRDGEFAFYAADNLEPTDSPEDALALASTITGSLDPYALVYASLRDHARDDMVEGVLARYPHARLTLPADRDIGRLGLSDADQDEIRKLRVSPAPIQAIIAGSAQAPQHMRRFIYGLLVTHMLAPEEERTTDLYKSQIGEESAPSERVSAPSPLRASQAGAQARPGEPARVIKPKVPGSVNEVASAAMPAWQMLMTMRENSEGSKVGPLPTAPSAVQSLRPPAGPRASIAGAMNDPASRKKRVEQFMQSNRFAEAVTLLDEMVVAEPTNAPLHGLRARALFEVHRADVGGLPRTVIDAVKKAHELDAAEPQAYFVKGCVFKQAGELNKAMVCWKRALEADPKHIDAARELRLAKLRNT